MIIAYSHTLEFPFTTALALAKQSFSYLNLSNISTPTELEQALMDAGEVLYVDADFAKQNQDALDLEQKTAASVDAMVGVLDCPEDGTPMVYTQEELDAMVFCDVPDEFPEPIDADEFSKEISDLEDELASIESGVQDDIDQVMSCVGEMQKITDSINQLIPKESMRRETVVSLEELLYNYRIMEIYFKKRVDRLDEILNVFDPLIIEKRRLDDEIERFTPIRDADKQKYTDLDKIINPQTYATNVGTSGTSGVSGSSGTSGTSGTPATTLPTYTQQQYADWQAAKKLYTDDETYLTGLQTDLQTVKDKLTFEQNKISPFVDTEVTTANVAQYGSNAEYQRQQFLENRLAGLFSGTDSIYSRVSAFSSRTQVVQHKGNPGQSFDLSIRHTLKDGDNVLLGKQKSYIKSNIDTTIEDVQEGETPSGTLYDKLYNIWDDDQKFFTREEKGLTATANSADPSIKGTGSEIYKGSYIGDVTKFRQFYENFPANWSNKVTEVKSNVIEPALIGLVQGLENFAKSEVEFLLAYGNAFQLLPAEDQWLGDITEYLRQSSMRYIERVNELRVDFLHANEQHKQILKDIETERGKYLTVKCAMNTAPKEQQEPAGAGGDPFGAQSLKANDPSKPNPTKWCYWLRFSAYATAVNVLPLPGQGGFRYWPIGMTIPNPSGLIKIPLPIIWIPIAVIPMQVGIFVIFIGLCGICPSPVVFYVGPNGEKKFIISLRPGDEFGSDASEQVIKTIDKLGLAVNTSISAMLNKIEVPDFKPMPSADSADSLLDDVKDKIIKNIQKLPKLPDVSKLNALKPEATLQDKRDALLVALKGYISDVKIPDLTFPKNGDTVNPKPPPVLEVLNQLKSAFKQNLPQIAIPSVDKINIKAKLIEQVEKLEFGSTPLEIKSPPVPGVQQNPSESAEYIQSVRDEINKVISKAKAGITPEQLGIVAEVASGGVTFINPYQCKGTISGISIPPLPPLVAAAVVAMDQLVAQTVGSLTTEEIVKMLSGQTLYSGNFKSLVLNVLGKLPSLEAPNPSKVSIKDMLKDSVKKLAKMQLPSLPDPTKPPQLKLSVPGDMLKGSMIKGLEGVVKAFPVDTINFPTLSPIDLKQIAVSMVEDSFAPVENAIAPFMNIASAFKASKDKTFPEILGMKKISPDTSKLPIVSKQAMDAAINVIQALSLVPYPAVAIAPSAFKNLHPVLASDDLPPWERFTLDNFLFVCFLDEWCKQGKKTCGFFENP